ncbi:hypothetical protein EV128_117114 [Rhizobium azibense]|nr:hypothetical protein EV128_117114 [Rhizobium azibense]
MNITHANIDMCGHIRMRDLPVIDFILARFRAASRAAKAWPSGYRRRLAMRRIEHFSDHRLHDIGFERDWDGSVITKQS